MTTATDSLTALTNARPAELDAPDSTIRERIYHTASNPGTRPQLQPLPRVKGSRYLVPAVSGAALAAVLVAAFAVQPLDSVSPHSRPASPSVQSASAVLLAAAVVAENTPVAPVGTYWHTSMQVFEAATKSTPSNTADDDDWISPQTNGQSWYAISSPTFNIPLSRATSTDPYHTRFDVLDRFLTFTQLQQILAEPAALKAYLLAIPPHHSALPPVPVSDRLFEAAVDFADTPASPPLRAAAFRLLAGLPGLTSRGKVTDPLGRTGVGIQNSYPGGDIEELIVDPNTGSLLSLEDLSVVNGHLTIDYYMALVDAGWTNTLDAAARA